MLLRRSRRSAFGGLGVELEQGDRALSTIRDIRLDGWLVHSPSATSAPDTTAAVTSPSNDR